MAEQRRHQRMRFTVPPCVRIGQEGLSGEGLLENLSLGGLMLRADLPLRVNAPCGVEFSVIDGVRLDLSLLVVSRVGDRYGARFSPGPLSECLIQHAMAQSVARGEASSLSVKTSQGRKVLRVLGFLGVGLRSDFLYAIHTGGVAEIDLSAVTAIDADGLALCRQALEHKRLVIVRQSACVRAALGGAESTHP